MGFFSNFRRLCAKKWILEIAEKLRSSSRVQLNSTRTQIKPHPKNRRKKHRIPLKYQNQQKFNSNTIQISHLNCYMSFQLSHIQDIFLLMSTIFRFGWLKAMKNLLSFLSENWFTIFRVKIKKPALKLIFPGLINCQCLIYVFLCSLYIYWFSWWQYYHA